MKLGMCKKDIWYDLDLGTFRSEWIRYNLISLNTRFSLLDIFRIIGSPEYMAPFYLMGPPYSMAKSYRVKSVGLRGRRLKEKHQICLSAEKPSRFCLSSKQHPRFKKIGPGNPILWASKEGVSILHWKHWWKFTIGSNDGEQGTENLCLCV